MDRDGHLGFSLLVIFSALYVIGIYDFQYAAYGVLSSFLSFIPDLDMKLRIKHRGITHSLVFALVVALGAGYFTEVLGYGFTTGFIIIFLAQALHILGDIFTYMPLKPLYPIVDRSISLKLFRSDNKAVNKGLLILGIAALDIYLLRAYGIDIIELLFRS